MFDFDEKQLIERTQQGEIEAFSPLVLKYYPKIYTYILGRIKSVETAKDRTQETWLKTFRGINCFLMDVSHR